MDQPKQYEAVIQLGSTTATDDPDSPPVPWPTLKTLPPSSERINNILLQLQGQVLQTPPAFSALKIGGRRAYQLARAGAPPTMTPRPVMIYGIEKLDYQWPLLRLRIDCGRGTYVRAIARDIGAALDVGGHLLELRRTKVGKFSVEAAVKLEELNSVSLLERLVPVAEAGGG